MCKNVRFKLGLVVLVDSGNEWAIPRYRGMVPAGQCVGVMCHMEQC